MEVREAQRLRKECVTRLYLEGGDHEDFKTVRASVAFPFGSMPGVLLIGGEKDTSLLKILVEREFQSMFDLSEILAYFKKKYGLFCVFHSEDPQTEEILIHLKVKFESLFDSFSCRFRRLQGTESYSFEIQLVNHFFKQNKLMVPKNGILATELEAGWESFLASEQKLRGILALFWLVIGIDKGDERLWFLTREDDPGLI